MEYGFQDEKKMHRNTMSTCQPFETTAKYKDTHIVKNTKLKIILSILRKT